ncbi:hypothetical protein ACLB1G_22540 [Oxalobacteraceae bacterium A2-2]
MKSLARWMLALLPLTAAAADTWLPVKDVSLRVVPGSILDFSSLASPATTITSPLIVTATGDFAVKSAPTVPRRFLMMSMAVGSANGGIPDKPVLDDYVTQIRLHGYNMVRLHYIDDTLMTDQTVDFNFKAVQLDRFYYLLAALKKNGIYYLLDGMSSDNGAYGVTERWINKLDLKPKLYYDAATQQHWKTLVSKLYGSVNPYTGISTLADPALAGLILVNEGGLAYILRGNNPPTQIQALFAAWLKKKYVTDTALKAAWGSDLKSTESVSSAAIALAKNYDPGGKRMGDTQRFFVDLEKSTGDWMTSYLRSIGYQGLVTSYDNWSSPAASISRGTFNWVDMHSYFAEPTGWVDSGSVMPQTSMLSGGLTYITELSLSRLHNKAFTVSEYGQVFWNKYRRESALAMPSYASFQNWSMIAQHAGGLTLAYDEAGGRKDRIYPFMVGPDPVARAGETLSALLYLRGDVKRAAKQVRLKMEDWYTFEGNGLYGGVGQDIKRLTMVHGVGLDWQGASTSYDAQLMPYNSDTKVFSATSKLATASSAAPVTVAAPIVEVNLTVDQMFSDRVTVLRNAGLLGDSSRDNTAAGVFLSDTNELAVDRSRRRMTVITPKTEAAVFDVLESVPLSNVRIDAPTGPALLAVSAMDGSTVNASKRLLVVLATDARNTGMTFSDPGTDTTLASFGTGPVTIKTVALRVTLTTANASTLKVYSVKLTGARGDSIPVVRTANTITFTLNTATLSHGPTTYFEIATN